MILEIICYDCVALSPVEELMWMGHKDKEDCACQQLCLCFWLKLRHLAIPRDNFFSSAQQPKR